MSKERTAIQTNLLVHMQNLTKSLKNNRFYLQHIRKKTTATAIASRDRQRTMLNTMQQQVVEASSPLLRIFTHNSSVNSWKESRDENHDESNDGNHYHHDVALISVP